MANVVIRRMFNRFERPCPLWEISQLDWNLSLVLRSSIHLPYELLKLSSDKHLTWKAWFSLVVTSAKRVSKFVTRKVGGLVPSFLICGQRPRTPLCMIHGSRGLLFQIGLTMDKDRDKILLCPISALKRFLSRTE